jgi:hypothetical protein
LGATFIEGGNNSSSSSMLMTSEGIHMMQIGFRDTPAAANVLETCRLEPSPELAIGDVFAALTRQVVPKLWPVQCYNHCVFHRRSCCVSVPAAQGATVHDPAPLKIR